MKLTIKQFNFAVNEVANYNDRDAYINDIALSSIFDDSEEEVSEELINRLSKIWDVVNMTIKDIRMTTGLSQINFYTKFCIPRRTLQSWESEERTCPLHEKLLLAAACGLIEFGEG